MLKTEERNENTKYIDRMTTEEMLSALQRENLRCTEEVGKVLPQITQAVDRIFPQMQKGGRLFYVGCGTSGRLGVLDASECPPTFGVPDTLVIGILSGGDRALRYSVEGDEDSAENGRNDLARFSPNETDSVIGISAAGEAAYVLGAISFAKEKNCTTVAISSNENSSLCKLAEVAIAPDTGAEAITGSTRLKAGTAQKMILNMISTSLMVKLGYVYENLMINLKPLNNKLLDRCIRITAQILNCSASDAEQLLKKNNWNIRDTIALSE